MKLGKRLKELESKITATGSGYASTLTDDESLELRTLKTIQNAMVSKSGMSFISSDVALYLLQKLEKAA